jgi:two-component system, chemotaxis family, CheB/CheR fusion protein
VRIDGPMLVLEPKAAQAFAVALHELATNAAKYGALSGAEGRIDITWSCAADKQLSLRWTERDGPPVKTPMREGFGTFIVGRMIREQLRGDVRLGWHPAGLECEIILPLTSGSNLATETEDGSALRQ